MNARLPAVLAALAFGAFAAGFFPRPVTAAEGGAEPVASGAGGAVLDRPVFRSVLDGRPRVASIPLTDDVWVAYDTGRPGIFKLWSGGVNWQGAVFNTVHGPQPSTRGNAWFVDDVAQPWRVTIGGREVRVAARYAGRVYDDSAPRVPSLVYALSGDGFEIEVTETPRLVLRDGRTGFERVFSAAGVPRGGAVFVELALDSLATEDALETDGRLVDVTWRAAAEGTFAVHARLQLERRGATHLTAWLADTPRIPPPAAGAEAGKARGLVLIEQSDCVACHHPDEKIIGPSWHAIAAKYPNDDATIGRLADRVRAGGSGVWGTAAMTPHPGLSFGDVSAMVGYILSLDGDVHENSLAEVTEEGISLLENEPSESSAGVAVTVFAKKPGAVDVAAAYDPEALLAARVAQAIHATGDEDFAPFAQDFYVEARGFIAIEQPGEYTFRLVSDDGSTLEIDGEPVLDNDGSHGALARDGNITLEPGRHAFLVRYFQGGGAKTLSLQWRPPGATAFAVVPPEVFTHDAGVLLAAVPAADALVRRVPGFGSPLEGVHPSFDLETVRPDGFQPMVGGLDVFDDGRVAVSTWDAEGSVYVLSNVDAEDRNDIVVERVAHGLAEPLGLRIVDGEIYVLQKQELTHLVDEDGDGVTDRYETVANGWSVTANFHEFAFGLEYVDDHFFAALATAILPGGKSAPDQAPSRGSVIRIARDGTVEIVARGLRVPNGIGLGPGGVLFVTDNQGDWLPSSKLVRVRQGAFYGSRAVDFAGTANLPVTPPVAWLPQDEIGNSPTQPVALDVGPYRGQLLHGDVTNGGIKRVFVEQVGGVDQGVVFRFTQGLEAGVNRLAWSPDGRLYVGGIGNPGNWQHAGRQWFGLQRLTYKGRPTFEMLAVRARPDGFEIELTEPLAQGAGDAADAYTVTQWRYLPTADYGGPKIDERVLPVRSVQVLPGRTRVRLGLEGLRAGHVVHIALADDLASAAGRRLWSGDAWYTLNALPRP